MAQYVGTAMLLSSSASPDAGKVGDLMILGPAGPYSGPYDVSFVFVYGEEDGKSRTILDHGMAVARGNQMSFTQKDTEVEYVFELLEWEMF